MELVGFSVDNGELFVDRNHGNACFCLYMVGANFNRLCDFVSFLEERLGADRITVAQLRCTCKMALFGNVFGNES